LCLQWHTEAKQRLSGKQKALNFFYMLSWLQTSTPMCDADWAKHYQTGIKHYEKDAHNAGSTVQRLLPHRSCADHSVNNFSWEDLSWYPETKLSARRVLHQLSGYVDSGQVMALLGPSGGGKTTLLDILAMRKTVGRIEGSVRVNGQERRPCEFQRASAFILQESILLPTLTVGETLCFYAEMLLPQHTSLPQKKKRVGEVLTLVGLSTSYNMLVGGTLASGINMHGISSGERKRLSIAAAMLPKPDLVFADEPTTGIDAFASLKIVEIFKDLAMQGKTVVVSIHQPRDAIWSLFDQLYLLSEGRLMYTGSPAGAITWFDSMNCKPPEGVSVADWLLDVVTLGFEKDMINWKCLADASELLHASNEFCKDDRMKSIRRKLQEAHHSAEAQGNEGILWPDTTGITVDTYTAVSTLMWQTRALMERHVLNYSRNLGNALARILLALVSGVLVGISYSALRHADESDPHNIQNRLGSLFFCCIILMMSPNCSMGLFVADRRFYSAEAAAQLYPSLAYYVPLAFCEVAVNMFAVIVFWAPVSLLTGAGQHSNASFILGFIICGLVQLCGAQIVSFCAMLFPNQELAFVSSVAANIIAFITGGFLVKTGNLPASIAWIRFLSPVKFGFHAFAINELADHTYNVGAQVATLDAALRQACLAPTDSAKAAHPFISWWFRRSSLQPLTQTLLGDIFECIDPCLFNVFQNGGEALKCLQLDEPSATSMLPSLVFLIGQVLTLQIGGWLCLRFLHHERR